MSRYVLPLSLEQMLRGEFGLFSSCERPSNLCFTPSRSLNPASQGLPGIPSLDPSPPGDGEAVGIPFNAALEVQVERSIGWTLGAEYLTTTTEAYLAGGHFGGSLFRNITDWPGVTDSWLFSLSALGITSEETAADWWVVDGYLVHVFGGGDSIESHHAAGLLLSDLTLGETIAEIVLAIHCARWATQLLAPIFEFVPQSIASNAEFFDELRAHAQGNRSMPVLLQFVDDATDDRSVPFGPFGALTLGASTVVDIGYLNENLGKWTRATSGGSLVASVDGTGACGRETFLTAVLGTTRIASALVHELCHTVLWAVWGWTTGGEDIDGPDFRLYEPRRDPNGGAVLSADGKALPSVPSAILRWVYGGLNPDLEVPSGHYLCEWVARVAEGVLQAGAMDPLTLGQTLQASAGMVGIVVDRPTAPTESAIPFDEGAIGSRVFSVVSARCGASHQGGTSTPGANRARLTSGESLDRGGVSDERCRRVPLAF